MALADTVHTTYDNARWGSHLSPLAVGLSELVATAPPSLPSRGSRRDETATGLFSCAGPWQL